jgi:hypothetical protein
MRCSSQESRSCYKHRRFPRHKHLKMSAWRLQPSDGKDRALGGPEVKAMGRREVTTNAIEGQLATAVTLLSAMREHSRREQRTTGLFVAEAKEIRTVGLFLVAGVGSEASRLSAPPRYDTAHCGPQRFGEPACLRIRVVRDDRHRQRFQERHGRGLIGVGQSRELRLRTGRLAPCAIIAAKIVSRSPRCP